MYVQRIIPWRVEAGGVPEREAVSDLNGGCSDVRSPVNHPRPPTQG